MNTKSKTHAKELKKSISKQSIVSPEFVVKQLGQDVRNSILTVSVLINVFFLIAWLVLQVSNRYDAALINYLQNK